MNLSKTQNQIRTAPVDRHIKVCAAPGSGKSTVACHRIVYLIQQHKVPPNRILVSMFNSDAVEEFSNGMADLGVETLPPVRTFHSLANRILKSFVKAGAIDEFEIETNEATIKSLQRAAVASTFPQELQEDVDMAEVEDDFSLYVGFCKGSLSSPKEVLTKMALPKSRGFFHTAFAEYEKLRETKNIITFDDLVFWLVTLLKENSNLLAAASEKFEHIIIDEYQDINEISNEMMRILAGQRAKVMVVGDDDQTINAWRGAEPRFLITEFDSIFGDPLCFYLDTTYRYGHFISMLANNTIRHNKDRLPKLCRSPIDGHESTVTLKEYTPSDGCIPHHCHKQPQIISEIKESIELGYSYNDIAILVRTNEIASYIETALIKNNIPYNVRDSQSILQSTVFAYCNGLICLAFFKNAPNNKKKTWLRSAVQFPNIYLNSKVISIVVDLLLADAPEKEFIKIAKQLQGYTHRMLMDRVKGIKKLMTMPEQSIASVLLNDFFEMTKNHQALRKSTRDDEYRSKLTFQLNSYMELIANEGRNLNEALYQFKKIEYEYTQESENPVHIMSVHRSKGLTFKTVIMPALSEGLFPYARNGRVDDMQSERRLFLVGMTRAKYRLLLLIPKSDKYISTSSNYISIPSIPHQSVVDNVSRFVYEINFNATRVVNESLSGNANAIREIRGIKSRGFFNKYLSYIGSNLRVQK